MLDSNTPLVKAQMAAIFTYDGRRHGFGIREEYQQRRSEMLLLVVGADSPALPTPQHTTTATVGFEIIEEYRQRQKFF